MEEGISPWGRFDIILEGNFYRIILIYVYIIYNIFLIYVYSVWAIFTGWCAEEQQQNWYFLDGKIKRQNNSMFGNTVGGLFQILFQMYDIKVTVNIFYM